MYFHENKNQDRIRIRIHNDPVANGIKLYILHDWIDKEGKRHTECIVFKDGKLKMIEIPENAFMQTFIALPKEEAEEIVSEFWQQGIQPTQAKGSVGQLEAVERHLQDMRKIAGDKLKIELK